MKVVFVASTLLAGVTALAPSAKDMNYLQFTAASTQDCMRRLQSTLSDATSRPLDDILDQADCPRHMKLVMKCPECSDDADVNYDAWRKSCHRRLLESLDDDVDYRSCGPESFNLIMKVHRELNDNNNNNNNKMRADTDDDAAPVMNNENIINRWNHVQVRKSDGSYTDNLIQPPAPWRLGQHFGDYFGMPCTKPAEQPTPPPPPPQEAAPEAGAAQSAPAAAKSDPTSESFSSVVSVSGVVFALFATFMF